MFTLGTVVSAVVEGLQVTDTVVVTLLPVSLSVSTVAIDPEEVTPGQSAKVTVTPKTGTGTNSGPGFKVTIETTLGTLTSEVVDNGDGTYSQQLETSTHRDRLGWPNSVIRLQSSQASPLAAGGGLTGWRGS